MPIIEVPFVNCLSEGKFSVTIVNLIQKKSAGYQAFVLRYSSLNEQKETICKKWVLLLSRGTRMKVSFLMRISRCDAAHYQVNII